MAMFGEWRGRRRLAVGLLALGLGASVGVAQAQDGRGMGGGMGGGMGRGKHKAQQEADSKKDLGERFRQEKTYPTKTTWALRSINGKPVPTEYAATFMIDDNFRGQGFGGCNYWSSTIYPQRGQKLVAGPPAVTKRECDKARMAAEKTFLVALHTGATWDIVGPQLILKNGSMTLVFDRAL